MAEPPDPGGGGGGQCDMVPPANNYVTITTHSIISNESGMDTDGSINQRSGRKRSRLNKICKNCNKKVRKHSQAVDGKTGCHCADSESNSDNSVNKVASVIHIENSVGPPIVLNTDGPGPQVNPVARNLYHPNDSAPFIVHVQRVTQTPDDGIILQPVSFGRFLKKNNVHNIINGSVKKIGRNRITLAFSSFNDANTFVSSSILSQDNLKAFIPTFNVTRMGLIRGVPSEWTPEEVIENMSVPDGCGKILKVRRINFKTMVEGSPIWKPTQSVVVTFDGQVLPNRVFMCYNALRVELYTYPTIQCYNCCRYGHTKLQCRSKPRCYKCGRDHNADKCDSEEENMSCCLCSGTHFAINKSCPEFIRQRQIKISMAENSISYGEAAKLIPPVTKSYADVVKPVFKSTSQFHTIPSQTSATQRHTEQQHQSSYRKTVFTNRRTAPKPGTGYDQVAHKKIIEDFKIPTPQDGCALTKISDNPLLMSNLDIITILINTLTQFNIKIPSNVAPIVEDILNNSKAINNGGVLQSSSEEVNKRSSLKKS